MYNKELMNPQFLPAHLTTASAVQRAPDNVVSNAECSSWKQTDCYAQQAFKHLCNKPLAPEAGVHNVNWVFCIGFQSLEYLKQFSKSTEQSSLFTVLSPHIKLQGKPCTNKDLAEAYYVSAGDSGEQTKFPHLFKRHPDWFVVMWQSMKWSNQILCR